MSSSPSGPERRDIRQLLRARRAALSAAYRRRAAQRIQTFISTTRWLQRGASVGLYVSVAPEVATPALRELAARRGCRVCLPRIVSYPARRMLMVRERDPALPSNRFGIGEPRPGLPVAVRTLSVLFLPVLGFDGAGTRLGSGAGYYDRLLQHGRSAQKPLLVGIAYDCARLPHIATTAYDVPLDAIVTESGIQHFRRGSEA
jgi:5-formyltetrahydrofolate cyclo-ligase